MILVGDQNKRLCRIYCDSFRFQFTLCFAESRCVVLHMIVQQVLKRKTGDAEG